MKSDIDITLIFIANDFAIKAKLIWVHSFVTYATFSEKLKFHSVLSKHFQFSVTTNKQC